ncbi:hypothetical protein NXS08_02255 [Gleimia sp. 6138-11-ORH1]|uniref:hypothetical protein n=1 Tax=Gleimia sp. 6138-11-ORH1 TaxID=2973937 RepID=UPI002167CE99|nr:hypothetical protein [Gleimia sp. 6138-11-ORH1]MCS4484313.1 hypothetical protein [Gleimia sp. 6138-11-ORH1]
MTTPENTPQPAEGQPTPPNVPSQPEVAPTWDGAAPASFEPFAAPMQATPETPQMPANAMPGEYPQGQVPPVAPQAPAYGQPVPQPGAPIPALGMPQGAPQPAGPSFSEQMNAAVNSEKLAPYRNIFTNLWKGDTGASIDEGDRNSKLWIPALSVVTVFSAFVYTFFISRMAGQVGSFLFGGYPRLNDRFSSYLGLPADKFFALLFGMIIMFGIGLALRAVALTVAAKLRQKTYSFTRAANLLAVAYLPSLMMISLVFVFALMPGTLMIRIASLMLFVLFLPMLLMSELIIYVGFNRQNGFAKSVLVPHVMLTGASMVLLLVIMTILRSIVD